MVMARWSPWKRSHRDREREREQRAIFQVQRVYSRPGQFTCFMYICFHLMLGAAHYMHAVNVCTWVRLSVFVETKSRERLLAPPLWLFQHTPLCCSADPTYLLLLSAPLRRAVSRSSFESNLREKERREAG
jgi:hypothetical protein